MTGKNYRYTARTTPLDATAEEDAIFEKIANMGVGAEMSINCPARQVNSLRSKWLWWRRKRKHMMLSSANYPDDIADPGAYISMRVDSIPGSEFKRFVFFRPEPWVLSVDKEGIKSTE